MMPTKAYIDRAAPGRKDTAGVLEARAKMFSGLVAAIIAASLGSIANAESFDGPADDAPVGEAKPVQATPMAEVLFEVKPPHGPTRFVSGGDEVRSGEQLRLGIFMHMRGHVAIYHRDSKGTPSQLFKSERVLSKGERLRIPEAPNPPLEFQGEVGLETLLVAVWDPQNFQAFRRALTRVLEGPVRARDGFLDLAGTLKYAQRGAGRKSRALLVPAGENGVGLIQVGLQHRKK